MRPAVALGAALSAPSLAPFSGFATHANTGAFRTFSRSQLGAVAKVQVFVEGYGDVFFRAAICAIWENSPN